MASTAEFDPIVVEPELTRPKIEELLTRRRESAKLDYKIEADLRDRRVVLELVKDVLAFANTVGGYIVVGVRDDGEIEGLEAELIARFDEATLRAQVMAHSSVPIPLFVDKAVQFEGKSFGIVTVLPLPGQITLAKKDACHSTGSGAPRIVFNAGDVLIRRGSASTRWNQDDADFLIRRIVETSRATWRKEFSGDLKEIGIHMPEHPKPKPAAGENVLDLPREEFRNAVINLLRGGNG